VRDPQLSVELLFSLGAGVNDRLADLILSLPEHPENLEALLARMRAWEDGIERLLGMEEGILRLHDYQKLAEALPALLQDESGPQGGKR
jgi:hypothetical protein